MRDHDPGLEALLRDGNVAVALAIQFVFPEGNFGLWSGQGDLPWNGFTYKGVDRIIGFSGQKDKIGNSSQGVVLKLSGIPSTKLDPDWQSKLENYQYDNAQCHVSWLGGDPNTFENRFLMRYDAYEVDVVKYIKTPEDQNGMHQVSIEIGLETSNRNLKTATFTRRSHRDHRRENDPQDTGLQHAVRGKSFKIRFGTITQ